MLTLGWILWCLLLSAWAIMDFVDWLEWSMDGY